MDGRVGVKKHATRAWEANGGDTCFHLHSMGMEKTEQRMDGNVRAPRGGE